MEKRAVRGKSPATSKRAALNKLPVEEKRAAQGEAPVMNVRAGKGETPMRRKRATRTKTPASEERADKGEAPVQEERAVRIEAPASEERAAQNETPVSGKRAALFKPPVGGKRASLGELPVTEKRAEEIESPGRNERLSPHLPRLATLFQSIQRDRVGLERSLATKADVHDPRAKEIYEQLIRLEETVVAYLHTECHRSPVWPWLSSVKGIGERLGGMLVGLIDIHRAPSISSLWKFAGLAPGADRRVKGQKLPYNNLLKKTCFLVARQFILAGTQPYEGVYREAKAYYEQNRPEWRPGHCDLAARRKAVKLFLGHLHTRWCEAEGLPIRPPYAMGVLHHDGYIPPPERVQWSVPPASANPGLQSGDKRA